MKTGLTKELMALRAAQELSDGLRVNLGIGLPILVSQFVGEDREVVFHSENGILGYRSIVNDDEETDIDLVNAGLQPVKLVPGASFFHHAESFAMIRGGKMIVPGGGPPALPTVSPLDTGEIAAQTVLREDLGGRRIRVTGPEAISFPEAARRISAVTGKRLEFQKIPLFPLRVASLVTWPFNPYLRHLVGSARLMNRFPQDLAAQVSEDHRWLVDTFSYTPTTLEMETRRRFAV